MADFIESAEYQPQAILHIFLAAQHDKGPADFEAGLLLCSAQDSIFFTHRLQIDNARQLHAFVQANHSEVTSEQKRLYIIPPMP